ncbi:MAG: hypothetical protein QUU85_01185 [Candidatus Eisenbacteria bacterium]|nr:hypothetical protein [Candidatus Eisenbacteria bacterium]
MKPSVLQAFVREWLALRGLEPEELEHDVWHFRFPKDLHERLGAKDLTLSFNQRAMARYPRGELATVGNPVFDRLLGVAREEGRIGVAYAKPPSPAAKPPAPEKAPKVAGLSPGKADPIYQGIYHLVFTVTYPTIEASDEMEVVSVDGGSLEVAAQTPDLIELWGTLESVPRKGRVPLPPVPLSQRVLDAALRSLEKRLRRRIKKVKDSCEERLAEETNSIQEYYEQLIDEARNQSRRWATRAEDREDRIRFLQLEWKRRTEEAIEFWSPRVHARLVALGVQMVPRTAYRFARPGAKSATRSKRSAPAPEAMIVWDDATKSFLRPYCAACGRPGLDDPVFGQAGGLVCPDCANAQRGNGEGTKAAARPALRVVATKAGEPS